MRPPVVLDAVEEAAGAGLAEAIDIFQPVRFRADQGGSGWCLEENVLLKARFDILEAGAEVEY